MTGLGTRTAIDSESAVAALVDLTRALAGRFELNTLLDQLCDALFRLYPQADYGWCCSATRKPAT